MPSPYAQLERKLQLFDLHAMPAPRREQREANPFRKHFGVCVQCNGHDSQLETRLYWCWLCEKSGCIEWLKSHKD